MAFRGLKSLVLTTIGFIPQKLNGNLKVLNLRPALRIYTKGKGKVIPLQARCGP